MPPVFLCFYKLSVYLKVKSWYTDYLYCEGFLIAILLIFINENLNGYESNYYDVWDFKALNDNLLKCLKLSEIFFS